jgi:hypothetical protein
LATTTRYGRACTNGDTRSVPVAPTQSRRAVLVGVAGVVAAVALFFLVVSLGSTRKQISFGSDQFSPGSADTVAARIADSKRPDCYNDPTTGSTPICIQHLGDDPRTGWVTVQAEVDGCAVQWDDSAGDFVDTCTGTHYPPTGDGLVRLPTAVKEGKVVVDVTPDPVTTTN